MQEASVINSVCKECGKSRKAHYDNIYCYAAQRQIRETVYVFPIEDFRFTLQEKEN
jgi:hypothetical protein